MSRVKIVDWCVKYKKQFKVFVLDFYILLESKINISLCTDLIFTDNLFRGPDKLSVQLGIYPTRFLRIAFFHNQLLKNIVLPHLDF